MNYFKQKMDDDNKAFIIFFCFLLLWLFVIVPIVLLVYSHNLIMFKLNEELYFFKIILIGYCLVALIVTGFFLFMVYKSQKKEKEDKLNNLIEGKLKNKGLENETVQNIIENKLKEKNLTNEKIQSLITWWINIKADDTELQKFITQVLEDNKIIS